MKSTNNASTKITKHIKIAEPCHENWNEMTPDAKGRHCDACDKVVVDFTDHSKEEIVDHLEKAEGKTCGRFKSTQIHKPVVSTPTLTKIAASIMAVVGSQVGLNAQEEIQWMGEAVAAPVPTQIQAGNTAPMILKGQVKNALGTGVANAKVAVHSGTHLLKSVLTNSEGQYHIDLNEGTVIANKISVIVHASGYEMKSIEELPLSKNESTLNLTMTQKVERMIMGKVACTTPIVEEPVQVIEEIHLKGDVQLVDPEPIVNPEPIIEEEQYWEEMGDVMIEEEVEVLKGVQEMLPEPDSIVENTIVNTNPAIYFLGGPMLVEEEITPLNEDVLSIDEEIEAGPIHGYIQMIEEGITPVVKEVDLTKMPITVNPVPLNALGTETVNGRFEVKSPLINDMPEPTNPNSSQESEQSAIETSSGLESNDDIEITLYPNPTTDFVNVRLDVKGEYNYTVQDILGKVIYKGFFTGNRIEFSFREQRSGVYIINVTNGQGMNQTKKVVLER